MVQKFINITDEGLAYSETSVYHICFETVVLYFDSLKTESHALLYVC